MQEEEKTPAINPFMLLLLVLFGGGVTGGSINMLIPKDAPDRYTGSMATHDWDAQSDINNQLRQEVERLRSRCVANEQKISGILFRFKHGVHIPHKHPEYERFKTQ